MELRSHDEMELPIRLAWGAITDVRAFEKLLQDRGAELTRSAEPDPPGLGTAWTGHAEIQGKRREVSAEVTRFDAPHHLRLDLVGEGLTGCLTVELGEGRKGRTRVDTTLTLAARTFRAKVVLQPLKLAHATMQARYGDRVSRLLRALEARRRKV